MWKLRMFGAAAGAALVMAAGTATPAEGQVQVGIRVAWDWGTVDVRAGDRVRYEDRRWVDARDLRYVPVRYVEVTGFRVPRGHRPRPGFCRLWYPGVAPGRQPRPVACHALRGSFHPDVLVVAWDRVLAPVFGARHARYVAAPRVVWRNGDYRVRWEDDRWEDAGWTYDGRYEDVRDDRYRSDRDRRDRPGARGARQGRPDRRPN